MNEESTMTTVTPGRAQLELTLTAAPTALRPRPRHHPRRFAAARWWFSKMRETVQAARDWPGTDTEWGPAEQIDLALSTRPTRLARRSAA